MSYSCGCPPRLTCLAFSNNVRVSPRRHPDKCKGDECESTFVAIAKAYEVLSDNETRADYDYALEHPDAVFYK